MVKRISLAALAVLTAVGTAACSSSASSSGTNGKIKVGFAIPTSKATYFTAYIDAVKAEAAKLGVSVNFAFAEDDAKNQNNQIATFATAGVSGIVLAPVDVDANVAGVTALGGSTKLITSNRFLNTTYGGASGENPLIHTGFSDLTVGENEGNLIVQACGNLDPCKVVLEDGTLGSAPQVARLKGTKNVLKEHPNIKLINVTTNNFQAQEASSVTSTLLVKYPKIDVLATQDDATAVAAVQSIKQAKRAKDIKVVGVGGSKDGMAAIKSGDMYGTVWVSPKKDGVIALDSIVALIKKQSIADQATVEGRPTVGVPILNVTAANADQYPGEW
ncbi:sugar ABC transporter substrate-binding protein [Streptomyces sioyaensis]|uniref:sugar ABC transporter substrate-binding protein n=1 Tax=Streptomyces sioyaensis TaxID=67364 RepID=UPI003D73E77C